MKIDEHSCRNPARTLKKKHELSGGRNWEERSDESDPVKLKKDGLTDMCVSLYSMVTQPKTSSPHTTNTKLFVVL